LCRIVCLKRPAILVQPLLLATLLNVSCLRLIHAVSRSAAAAAVVALERLLVLIVTRLSSPFFCLSSCSFVLLCVCLFVCFSVRLFLSFYVSPPRVLWCSRGEADAGGLRAEIIKDACYIKGERGPSLSCQVSDRWSDWSFSWAVRL